MIKRRKNIVLITFFITLILIVVNSTIFTYAVESTVSEDSKVQTEQKEMETRDFVEVNISDDFVVLIKNPSGEGIYRDIEISYYDENEEIIYEKNIDVTIDAFKTEEIDAKQYFNSSSVKKITVKPTIKNPKKYSSDSTYGVLIVLGIIMLLGICFLGLGV